MADKPRIQARTIEKMFENKDFKLLATSTMSFSNDPDPELIEIWLDVFESIIRANPNIRSFKYSIILLFSSIAEIFYLNKDRETRQRQKQEMYDDWIKTYEKQIDLYNEYIGLAEANISSIKNEVITKKKTLTPMQIRKINDYSMAINDHNKKIVEFEQRIKSCVRSKELRMFEVTKAEKIIFDMTAQMNLKNERLIQLLKEFNINPKLADVMNPENREAIFTGFKNLGDNE